MRSMRAEKDLKQTLDEIKDFEAKNLMVYENKKPRYVKKANKYPSFKL